MNSFHVFTIAALNANPQRRDALLRSLENLFTAAPPDQLRDTLIEIYQIYIMKEHEHGFPLHFPTMATHIFILLDSLREIEVAVFNNTIETE